ncbi:MAG: hypothetical protein FRX49_02890 [Trebouxia sp. A1-2]|nr:MAG: hypothetical protein FRX49_02890 [Trebouxia sp. A1-2]
MWLRLQGIGSDRNCQQISGPSGRVLVSKGQSVKQRRAGASKQASCWAMCLLHYVAEDPTSGKELAEYYMQWVVHMPAATRPWPDVGKQFLFIKGTACCLAL